MDKEISIDFVDEHGNIVDTLKTSNSKNSKKEQAKTTYLDEKLIWDLHYVIESSDIFMREEPLKHKYNLFCAFKDRMFSAVKYLNEHIMNN